MGKNIFIIFIAVISTSLGSIAQVTSTFTDSRDGKSYKTVKIGTQTWMAENLAYKTGNGCWAYNEDITNVSKYGYLYDWRTAKEICPTGWHLPTFAEWSTLTSYLGGESVAGIKMKVTDTAYWKDSHSSYKVVIQSNSDYSGFSALPGGLWESSFYGLGWVGGWWSSSDFKPIKTNKCNLCWLFDNSYRKATRFSKMLDDINAYALKIYSDSSCNLCRVTKYYFLSVRCLCNR